MIANCKPISHGKAAAEYDENKRIEGEHVAHEVMRQDVFGLDGAEIVKEMQECQASSKHRLKNAYFRIEIVPSHEEEAATWTDEQWQDVINEYSQRMGIQNAQAYWVLHRRTDHDKELPHVHGLVNRIDKDGNVLSDKFCQKRSIDVITQMTKKRGYKTADEVSKDLRTTIKETARQALGSLENYDFEAYTAACAELGLTVRPNISTNGHRNGYYFAMDGKEFKASQIDRALTEKRIQDTYTVERENYERDNDQDIEQGWGQIFKR